MTESTGINEGGNDTGALPPAPPLKHLRVVLCRTTHPGNIGATARAMKVMGVDDLVIVAPKSGIFPSEEATARAVSAENILENARVVDTLQEAVQDCAWVVGTTARHRHIGPPVMAPRDWAAEAMTREEKKLALVFGRESTGLHNDEVALCQALIRIPTQEAFASLNLGSAVQILMYEWRLAQGGLLLPEVEKSVEPATHAELESFYGHLRRVSDRIEFFARKNPDSVHRRLRAIYGRAKLDKNEINVLRGFLRDVERKLPGGEVD